MLDATHHSKKAYTNKIIVHFNYSKIIFVTDTIFHNLESLN